MNQLANIHRQERSNNIEEASEINKVPPVSSKKPSGLEKTGTLDAFLHDKEKDLLILAMFEFRPWDLGDHQLFQLQEKLNAYLSFVLDGEMEETFPHLIKKPVCIQLRSLYEPSDRALDFIARARDQLSYQKIDLQVVLMEDHEDPLVSPCHLDGACSCSQGSEQICTSS